MDTVPDRDALYYPFIHIRDANWLKAALLTFPQVRRIVPSGFTLSDLEEIRPFGKVRGATGTALLADEPAEMRSVQEAQERLLERLEAAPREALERFTRARAEAELAADSFAFHMHAGKMRPLLYFLRSHGIAWPARPASGGAPAEWFAMHPRLGEAIMSVIAIAIAEEKKLDIVTSSGRIHGALARLDDESIVAPLLGGTAPKRPAEHAESNSVDELCQAVMLTGFDLAKLTALDIAELQKDGRDLKRFKNELLKITAAIPDIADAHDRERRLQSAAGHVVDEWEKYKKSLPRFAQQALADPAGWKPAEALASVIPGSASSTLLTAGAGIMVGLAVLSGAGAWRGYREKVSSPYQFLTRIQRAGASLAAQPVHTRLQTVRESVL